MQGGAAGSKSYLMVVEIHDAAIIQTLTSPVAANQLAANAFFSVKMTTPDFTSPVAAIQLAAGAFFLVKMTTPGFYKPCCCYPACRGRFCWVKMTTKDLTSPVAANQLAAGTFFGENDQLEFDKLRAAL